MTPEETLRNILKLVEGSDEVEDANALQILLQSINTTESESRTQAWVESAIWRDSRLSMSEAEMGLQRSDDSESRFTGYVEGLVSVLGHADRAGPLRDYCVGLMMPCERKSVEPMAAVTAPERTAAQHQSLLHFVGQAAWSDEKVLAKVREMVLPAIERHGRSKRGSSTTPPSPRRDRTRSGWGGNIAANSASRTTVRSRCRCRLPIATRACRWPIACICRKTGRRTVTVGVRPGCLRMSVSRPSQRSRLSRSKQPAEPGFLAAWC